MSTHALDPHPDDSANIPSFSNIADKVEERMPNSLKSIYQRAKNRVNQVLNMPSQLREMIDKVRDGHPLSKAEWAAIMATPGSFLIAGYYIIKVAENTGNGIINEIKSQYHMMLEGLGLRKEATPDEFPDAVAKSVSHDHDTHPKLDQHETNHHVPKPKAHTAHAGHGDAHAANDDHHGHHAVEHPEEHAEAA